MSNKKHHAQIQQQQQYHWFFFQNGFSLYEIHEGIFTEKQAIEYLFVCEWCFFFKKKFN